MTNNQLTENSVTQLLNNVRLARDNAERDDNRVDHSFYYALTRALEELQERRKAERDSEPVAWINGCNKSVPAALRYLAENPRPIGGESSFNTAHLYQLAREIELMAEAPLYSHAQQPVVPDESYQQLSELYHAQEKRLFKIAQLIKGPAFDKYSHSPSQAIDVLEGAIFGEIDACRAAMLQELQKSAGVSNNCRSNEKLQAQQVESLTTTKATSALDSLPKNAESRSGNSLANDTNVVKRLTITLPDTSSKAFWSGTGKTETFHPVTYRLWVKEAIERYCAIARIDVEVK